MFSTYRFLALGLLVSLFAWAEAPAFQDALLDRMTGKWTLQGNIAGKSTTHDVEAEWILGHQYLRIQEVSREKDARNQPAYDAIIFIGKGAKSGQYSCLWLDNTGAWDFTSEAIGRGTRSGDDVVFRFKSNDGSGVKTTFAWNKTTGMWHWLIDNETGGRSEPFARVSLTRK